MRAPPYRGFYVDIGAYKPVQASNSYWFYERGWRGINIEPRPGSKAEFDRLRPEDTNLCIGVSDGPGTLDYYFFGELHGSDATINTFDPEQAKEFEQLYGKPVEKVIPVEVQTMEHILDTYLPAGTYIDFVTMDVENFELQVLRGWNFEKYTPGFFLIEDLAYGDKNRDFMEFTASKIYQFLREKGYVVIGKNRQTVLFRKKDTP
jgi:FkbM family methyltransferase